MAAVSPVFARAALMVASDGDPLWVAGSLLVQWRLTAWHSGERRGRSPSYVGGLGQTAIRTSSSRRASQANGTSGRMIASETSFRDVDVGERATLVRTSPNLFKALASRSAQDHAAVNYGNSNGRGHAPGSLSALTAVVQLRTAACARRP